MQQPPHERNTTRIWQFGTTIESTGKQRADHHHRPAASHWLKRAASELWERDTVDALNDLDVLRELLEEKHRIHALMLQQMVTSHDGTRY